MISSLKTSIAKDRKEAFASQFLNMSPDLMVLVSLENGTIDFFNEAWIQLSGYTRAELEKITIWALLHPDDLAGVKTQLQNVQNGKEQAVNYKARMICKNGDVKYILWGSTVDRVNGFIYAIGRDVTDIHIQNQVLLENEQKFEFISENSFEGVCIHVNNKLVLANHAFYKMFGFKSENSIINKNFFDFIADNELKKVKKLEHENFEGVFETKGKTKNGEYFPLEIQVKSITYKNRQARITSIRNITERKSAIEQLTKSENRYHSVFQNQAVGLVLLDVKGMFISANAYLLNRLGYTENEFLQLPLSAILHHTELEDASQTFKYLQESNVPSKKRERKFIKKDSTILWLNCTSSLVNLNDGEQMFMVVLEDIDQKKKLEADLVNTAEKLRAIYEGSPMGIMISRHPGIIIDCNATFAEMLGYTPVELSGKNILEFTHPSDISRSEKLINKVYHEKLNVQVYEKKYLKKNGSVLWAKSVVSQMRIDENALIAVTFIENIEKKKQTEHALEIKNRELLYTIQELEHFAYVASHDLQEPLRTITSFIQILDKRYKTKLDEDGQQFMSYVVEGAKRMQNLIRDLLEYSRINRLNTSYEDVNLDEVFQTVNRVLKDKIDSTDAIILAENLPVVKGNKLQITQVFQNLVDNAIKFRGKKKPEIEICVNNNPDNWEFSFHDNGIGINNEYFQRIFIIFQRLHTHEEYTGTGIGLAICKKIIERHGGNIWVESKPGKGTTFYFTIAKNLSSPVHAIS